MAKHFIPEAGKTYYGAEDSYRVLEVLESNGTAAIVATVTHGGRQFLHVATFDSWRFNPDNYSTEPSKPEYKAGDRVRLAWMVESGDYCYVLVKKYIDRPLSDGIERTMWVTYRTHLDGRLKLTLLEEKDIEPNN